MLPALSAVVVAAILLSGAAAAASLLLTAPPAAQAVMSGSTAAPAAQLQGCGGGAGVASCSRPPGGVAAAAAAAGLGGSCRGSCICISSGWKAAGMLVTVSCGHTNGTDAAPAAASIAAACGEGTLGSNATWEMGWAGRAAIWPTGLPKTWPIAGAAKGLPAAAAAAGITTTGAAWELWAVMLTAARSVLMMLLRAGAPNAPDTTAVLLLLPSPAASATLAMLCDTSAAPLLALLLGL